MIIELKRLFGWIPKIDEVVQDIKNGELSRTDGPIIVSRLITPRRCFYMIDGYHRVIEAILRKELTFEGEICEYVPNIERTGGDGYKLVLKEKHQIMSYPLVLEMINMSPDVKVDTTQPT